MDGQNDPPMPRLPFPPLTRSHILHCSYHSWYPRYRSITPKARLIPLDAPFLSYLRADGILLPPEDNTSFPNNDDQDTDSGIFSSASSLYSSSSEEDPDPSLHWPEIHAKIRSTIHELGGNVIPKLNWSAPKDATWINATNNMECRTPNDVYLLLKSSDFITHDLEQAFDGCEPPPSSSNELKSEDEIPYHLILRKTIPTLHPSLEFRCFVRSRTLLCICQRDLHYYDFLPALVPTLRSLIQGFFDEHLRDSFEDENFVFDVYVSGPERKRKVWLVDINPWAGRTDPLLFSWLEVLGMEVPGSLGGADGRAMNGVDGEQGVEEEEEGEEDLFTPEFRLVNRNDPEAYSFNTPQYSAHKMPKDVVDASGDGEAGLRDFMGRWREIVREQEESERKDRDGI
ncbi:MAG: hypothetical protein Q9225_004346 [Loekoesia sp. 1 TL-2023]